MAIHSGKINFVSFEGNLMIICLVVLEGVTFSRVFEDVFGTVGVLTVSWLVLIEGCEWLFPTKDKVLSSVFVGVSFIELCVFDDNGDNFAVIEAVSLVFTVNKVSLKAAGSDVFP